MHRKGNNTFKNGNKPTCQSHFYAFIFFFYHSLEKTCYSLRSYQINLINAA
jgi:hypothetical protein